MSVANAAATSFLVAIRTSKANGGTSEAQALLPRWPLPAWLRSTRALERFRNEVLLATWLDYYVLSVIAIFEDRQQLWGFKPDGTLMCRQLPTPRQVYGYGSTLNPKP